MSNKLTLVKNKHKKAKSKATGPSSPVRTDHMSVEKLGTIVVHNTALRTVLIIFPLILQTITTALPRLLPSVMGLS